MAPTHYFHQFFENNNREQFEKDFTDQTGPMEHVISRLKRLTGVAVKEEEHRKLMLTF